MKKKLNPNPTDPPNPIFFSVKIKEAQKLLKWVVAMMKYNQLLMSRQHNRAPSSIQCSITIIHFKTKSTSLIYMVGHS
ncbi:hypothetical protein QL285_017925 [Trifolium repens]|nr:hypothetical protein QL285_017925 [Trifolium repens]